MKILLAATGLLLVATAVNAQEVKDTPKGTLSLSVVGAQCAIYSHSAVPNLKFGVVNLNAGMSSVISNLESDHRHVSITYQTDTLTSCDGDSAVVPVMYATPKH